MAHKGTLTATQERALLALLSERTVEDAATSAKVGLRTLWRWMTQPSFVTAYRQARAEAVSQAIGRLQHASSQAVDTLTDIMQDRDTPAAVRVQAASKVLDMAVKGAELAELQRRLDELERGQEIPPATDEEKPIVSD